MQTFLSPNSTSHRSLEFSPRRSESTHRTLPLRRPDKPAVVDADAADAAAAAADGLDNVAPPEWHDMHQLGREVASDRGVNCSRAPPLERLA